jgi:UDP-N-acetylmuramate--alanine ligase
MSGLARLLLGKKAIVTGSDQNHGAAVSRLNEMGARIYAGHSADHLDPATDVVVVSAAIRESNPELQQARRQGCRIFKYAQFLGELMNHFEGIAISGTHGKSTTSGWLVHSLKQIGIDPNFVVGADILQCTGDACVAPTSSGCGDSDLFVVEACEYDRSFHNFKPAVACILNIERDHLDCYRDEDDIIESFVQFARGTRPDGVIVANGEDPNVRTMLNRLAVRTGAACVAPTPRIVTFGLDSGTGAVVPTFSARNVRTEGGFYHFDVFQDGRPLGPTRISLPGLHNVRNALAVVAMAVSVGPAAERSSGPWPEQILDVLDGFQGMDRRLMLKGIFPAREEDLIDLVDPIDNEVNPVNKVPAPSGSRPSASLPRAASDEIVVLDDYAHHPTEIRASLQAIRQRYQPRRLWCVFQAHQYSRTQALLDEFAQSFAQADKVIIPEIYFARDSEASCSAVNARILAERIRACGADAQHIAMFDAVCDYLEKNVDAGDVVVTMGAGDVWKVSDEYIQRLRRNR